MVYRDSSPCPPPLVDGAAGGGAARDAASAPPTAPLPACDIVRCAAPVAARRCELLANLFVFQGRCCSTRGSLCETWIAGWPNYLPVIFWTVASQINLQKTIGIKP
jgi:hypothetical protein